MLEGSSSFTAQPASIRQLGTQFIEAAQSLSGPVATFGGSALEIAQAFGLLGACDDAMEKYIQMAKSTQASLQQLVQVLEAAGGQLRRQGTNYELVDSTVNGQITAIGPGASSA